MPGQCQVEKVVVYTGIMAVAQDETGLAVIMGHEIGHAIAEHGGERMSQGLLQELGGIALSTAIEDEPETTKALFFTAYGLGTTIGIMLPYSRSHESEADEIGLSFMAMAGYNPNAAVDFWQRMADLKQGGGPPEFLSTHPSDETRIADIKSHLPKAMKYYNEVEFDEK